MNLRPLFLIEKERGCANCVQSFLLTTPLDTLPSKNLGSVPSVSRKQYFKAGNVRLCVCSTLLPDGQISLKLLLSGIMPRAYAGGRVSGLKPLLELNILHKLYYLRKGDYLFSHTFCLLVCQLNANSTEWICLQISRNIANGPKSNNYFLVGIWVIVCIQKPSHHFLQTFRPLRMFKIMFSDSSLHPKQLSSFCLLWLMSASADYIDDITNF